MTPVVETMESIYTRGSADGLRVFLGEKVNPIRKSRVLPPPNKKLVLYIATIPSTNDRVF
jgi:hypothetical protein